MQYAVFERLLEEEKTHLEHEMEHIGVKNTQVPGTYDLKGVESGVETDTTDQADILASDEENATILADLESRYQDILQAQQRFNSGTYGVCVVCGNPIEEDRLKIDPAAATCARHRDTPR